MIKINGMFAAVALLPFTLGLGGCGTGKAEKAATQVVAKVNGDEITVHQVNALLTRAQGVTAENAAKVRQEVLDKLIEQQLLVRQAEELRLDRSPAVVQSLEAARREILARAYLEQKVAALPPPGAAEVSKYLGEHPELFSARRIYTLQEVLVPASAGLGEEVKRLLAQGRGFQDMTALLRSRQVNFVANQVTRAPEQLPLESLPRFAALKDGETMVLEGPQGLAIEHLVSSQSAPIDDATARARIEQFLIGRRNGEFVAGEVRSLKEKARVERLGEFALAAAATGTPAVNLDKGVAGLK